MNFVKTCNCFKTTFFSLFLHPSAAADHTIRQPFEARTAMCGKPTVYRGTSVPASSHIQYLWKATHLCSLVDNTQKVCSKEMTYLVQQEHSCSQKHVSTLHTKHRHIFFLMFHVLGQMSSQLWSAVITWIVTASHITFNCQTQQESNTIMWDSTTLTTLEHSSWVFQPYN
jgi:hypothetical protein